METLGGDPWDRDAQKRKDPENRKGRRKGSCSSLTSSRIRIAVLSFASSHVLSVRSDFL